MDKSSGIVKSDLLNMSAMLKSVFWCFASSSAEGVLHLPAGTSGEAEDWFCAELSD